MTIEVDVCVVSPFRRPHFRQIVSHRYPIAEPWDSPQFQIAGILEQASISVVVLPLQTLFPNFNLQRDRPALDELLLHYNCRVLLFCGDHFVASRSTATTFGIEEVLLTLERIGRSPTTALMGRLATTAAERILSNYPRLDAALLGECDLKVPEFIRNIIANKCPTELPFVATRKRPKAVPERLEDLSVLPCPAYHLARPLIEWGCDTQRLTKPVPFSMRTSAGCVFKCKFCAGIPDWTRWRNKSPSQLWREVNHFQSSIGDIAQLVFLEDELLTVDTKHIDAVVNVFSEFNLRLAGFYTHTKFIDFDRAKKLSKVFSRVYLGMDAADNNVLESMGKRQTVTSMLSVLQSIRASGLGIHIECIIGSPHETRQSILKNLAALHNFIMLGLVDAANSYIFTPHPGTAYAESAEMYGLEIIEDFDNMQETGGYPAFRTKNLSRNEIFSAYLISQIVIKEAMQEVRVNGCVDIVGEPDLSAFYVLFSHIAEILE